MYPDPKKVKDNRLMVRLDDYEDAQIKQLSVLTGEQPSALARQLMMREAQRVLTHMQSMQRMAA